MWKQRLFYVQKHVYRRCADRSLAADLTQEVFLKLVTAVYRYSVTGKFTNYLFTIAVNVCNDYYRRKKPDSAELSEDCAALGGAEEQMLRQRQRDTPRARRAAGRAARHRYPALLARHEAARYCRRDGRSDGNGKVTAAARNGEDAKNS